MSLDPKVRAVSWHLEMNYPWVQVHTYEVQIGRSITDISQAKGLKVNPLSSLRRLISEVDLVIDCTASREVQMLLAFECRDLGKPVIIANATEGAVGGIVASFSTDTEACFNCLLEHWIADTIAEPQADRGSNITPVGCTKPTFSGGAFDLQEVSLEVVRTAVGSLAPRHYPKADWDLATLQLRDGAKRLAPRWRTEKIAPHPNCSAH